MGEQSRHNEYTGNDSMQVGSETIFEYLIDIKENVAGIQEQVKDLDDKIGAINEELPAIKSDAQDAKAQADKLNEKMHTRTQYLLYAWIPLAVATIPTLLSHIHFQ